MVRFQIAKHKGRPNVEIVEVLIDGKVIAVIYPSGDKGIKLVSAHVHDAEFDTSFADRVIYDDGTESLSPIPSVLVTFNPGPYEIVNGRIARLNQG